MERYNRLLASATLMMSLLGSSQAQGWRGIRPLHSTREDVERLIGSPMQPKGITYDLKNERVNVVYSDGKCAKGWPYGWNVPPGTVIGITIYPQTRPKLADLPIDLSKFKRYVDPQSFVHYTDDEEGLSVAIDPSEQQVRTIEYFPVTSDAHLRCPEAAERERQIESGESAARSPDVYYSDSSPEKRHVYLDYLADQLQKISSDSTVYILGYAGQRATVGEAQARANLAKDYLTQKRGIDPRRIVIVDGGHRDPAGVDLYITRRGQPKPLSSPNIYPGNVQIIDGNNASNNRHPSRRHHRLRQSRSDVNRDH